MTPTQEIEQAIKHHLSTALFNVEHPKPDMRGKVRDIFFKGDLLYMVNTDRISAFDQILGSVPLKGALLCEQSEYWFKEIGAICPHHLVDRPDPQIMVCKKAQPFLVEVIVRGYLAGSLMRENPHSRGSAYGLRLDPDLKSYQQLPTPIITPTTKADYGKHDMPISAQEVVAKNLANFDQWQTIEQYALGLFTACSKKALLHGLLLVDTKYEFGLINGKIHLIDEVHTSDSSRFFMKDDYEEKFRQGNDPLMLDKFLRQKLLKEGYSAERTISLNDEMRLEVAKRYFMLTEKITGQTFATPAQGAITRVHEALERLVC